ncbi:leucine-rich repeat-containing protein 74A-like isoform X2 [Symsagittifera roscoffensis]|uniref:leucine-rich repeat-containing protein 74A-like isoform X2 n=1 Tax=Symsagittifera roscoffensis TaxID=84072 RepID=UPI00307B90DB
MGESTDLVSRDKSDSQGPPKRTPSVTDKVQTRKNVSRPTSSGQERISLSRGSQKSKQSDPTEGGDQNAGDHTERGEGYNEEGEYEGGEGMGEGDRSYSGARDTTREEEAVFDPDKEYDTDLEIEESKESFDRNWEEIYVEACKRYNVVPASYFQRNMRKENLIMRHHGLGAKGAQAIAVALVTNTSVVKLDLSDNNIEEGGALAIAEMLKENFYIAELSLADNAIGEAGMTAVSEIMRSNPSLTTVCLSGCELDDSMALIIGDAIEKMQKVEVLDLSHNKLGDKSAEALSKGISESMSLRSLDISWNNFRPKGIVTLAKGIKQAYSMTKCNLSWNGIENEGALALADAIKTTDILKELDISNTRMNTEAAINFAKGLAVNETLLVLRMGTNPMESAGCYGVITQVMLNPNSKLQEIYFDDIIVNKDFDEQLAKLHEIHPNIQVFPAGHEEQRKKKVPAKLDHPCVKVKKFCHEKNINLLELFQQVDKEGTFTISKDDFRSTIQETGLELTDEEMATITVQMDRDMSGFINYHELFSETKLQEARDEADRKYIEQVVQYAARK